MLGEARPQTQTFKQIQQIEERRWFEYVVLIVEPLKRIFFEEH